MSWEEYCLLEPGWYVIEMTGERQVFRKHDNGSAEQLGFDFDVFGWRESFEEMAPKLIARIDLKNYVVTIL